MKVNVVLRVHAYRYYQHLRINDYYDAFSEEERTDLKEYLGLPERLNNELIINLTNNGEYHGDVRIIHANVYEDVNSMGRVCLYITAIMEMSNPDNYTVNKIEKIIQNTNTHYYLSGPVGVYGPEYYYYSNSDDPTLDQVINYTKSEFETNDSDKTINIIIIGI